MSLKQVIEKKVLYFTLVKVNEFCTSYEGILYTVQEKKEVQKKENQEKERRLTNRIN